MPKKQRARRPGSRPNGRVPAPKRTPRTAPREKVFLLGGRRLNRFDLYELAVQAPAMEAAFVRAVHGGNPRTLCEDFCGPASVARAWCALHPRFDAVAVDRDPVPLAHARARAAEHDQTRNDTTLTRLRLKMQDVLSARGRADIIASFNFAVCELHQRDHLLAYLRSAKKRLKRGGVLVADLYGGPGSLAPSATARRIPTEGGTLMYRWEQRRVDPLTARVVNAIHFILPGKGPAKSRTFRDAFVYDWRLWTVAELRDAMLEAGFAATEVYNSYGDAVDSDGNLYVRPCATDDEPGEPHELGENFVVYIAGRV